MITKCDNCRRDLQRRPAIIKRSKNHFCNQICFGDWSKKTGRCTGKNNPYFGRMHSPEIRKKMSMMRKGKTYEEIYGIETATRLKKVFSDNAKTIHTGKVVSEKTKDKLRARRGQIPWNKGKTGVYSEESLEKISKGHMGKTPWNLGKHHSESTRKKLKEKWKDKEYVKKIFGSCQPNGKELYLDFILQNHFPDEWQFVGTGEVTLNGLCPDFINRNGKKQIIELFGDYWHNRNNIKYHQTEKGRKEAYDQEGYTTLIVWEHELNNENGLIEKIRNCFKEL